MSSSEDEESVIITCVFDRRPYSCETKMSTPDEDSHMLVIRTVCMFRT